MQDGGVWSGAVPCPRGCCVEGKVPLIPWARRLKSPISQHLNANRGINYGAREVWRSLVPAPRWLLKRGQVPKSEGWEMLPPHWDPDPVLRHGEKERKKENPHRMMELAFPFLTSNASESCLL